MATIHYILKLRLGTIIILCSMWYLVYSFPAVVHNAYATHTMMEEICDNGIDDDGDGLIDIFDPDCPCDDTTYQAQCEPACEDVPDPLPEIKMKLIWQSVGIAGNSYASNIVIDPPNNSIFCQAIYQEGDSVLNGFLDLDLQTGRLKKWNFVSKDKYRNLTYIGTGDVNSNGSTNIFIRNYSLGVSSYSKSGILHWRSTDLLLNFNNSLFLNLADFNEDGVPEVYGGSKIINSLSGDVVFSGNKSEGCNFFNPLYKCSLGALSIAGDLTPHNGLELACGNIVYEVDINNLNDTLGNTHNIIEAPSPVLDGFTSLGDIDGDGELDVVVVRSNQNLNGGIWVWNPRNRSITAQGIGGLKGGKASIGDIDGDCNTELIVAFERELRIYKYTGSKNLEILNIIPTTDTSGHTGLTLFDFDLDGKQEIVYRDETYLKIIDGATGYTLDSISINSVTGAEYPIVTDVDNDGHAEILVNGHLDGSDSTRIFCFEAAVGTWAPARRVWNQYSYHVTNVNDDLTIPQYQQNQAAFFDTDSCIVETCPQVYNTFGVQATYRTQHGCVVYAAEDDCITDEVCDDGIDNDGDGLIDIFDPDCFCNDTAYQAQCEPTCEIIPDPLPEIKMKLKWQSVGIAGNSYASNIVIDPPNNSIFCQAIYQEGDSVLNGFLDLDLQTGRLKKWNFVSKDKYRNLTYIGTGDVNSSGSTNIFIRKYSSGITSYSKEGIEQWISDTIPLQRSMYLNLADFNNDGTPELYSGNNILNSITGNVLFSGKQSAGCNFFLPPFQCSLGALSIAGDLTSHNGLELACGNMVYEVDINNLNDTLGNTYNIIEAPAPVLDGFTSLGDIDGDGELDVVVVRSNLSLNGGVWIWNPRDQSIIAQGTGGLKGGKASIGDIDGDCIPEIIVAFERELRIFKYSGSKNLEILHIIPTTDTSGFTGLTLFDLDLDGKHEIIYRDETYLKIIDGELGITLDSVVMNSITGREYPIVTDVDNDGQAEILVNGYLDGSDSTRIFCFEAAVGSWAPARRVWNQYSYHVTNVNDDLTIPQYQQNQAAFFDTDSCIVETCPQVYNTFGVQATYRTQHGCVVYASIDEDLEVSADYICSGDSIELCLFVTSIDTATLKNGVPISCYLPPWDIGSTMLLDQVTVTSDTTCLTLYVAADVDSIMIVVNDDGGIYPPSLPNTSIAECDYDNNFFVLYIAHENFVLDLGPDISRCETDSVVLVAQSGFASYLWSDMSIDSSYTVYGDGTYFVKTIDGCGRSYRDTIIVSTDTAHIVLASTSDTICKDESVTLSTILTFDSIVWYPQQLISCSNCTEVTITLDTSMLISVTGIIDDCMSMDSIYIYVTPQEVSTTTATICVGDSIYFYDEYIYDAGTYEKLTSDCDSLLVLELDTFSHVTDSMDISVCIGDSTAVGTTWYSTEGTYHIDLTSAAGCDSTVILFLEIMDSIRTDETFSICGGDSVLVDGIFYYLEASFVVLDTTRFGCDSITSVYVVMVEELVDTTYLSMCNGDSVFVFSDWEHDSGSYSLGYSAASGCDSTHTVVVAIDSSYSAMNLLQVCEGDSLLIGDKWVYTTIDTSVLLATIHGCDSIITFHVDVSNYERRDTSVTFCDGDSIVVNGIWHSESMMMSDTVLGVDCSTIYDYSLIESSVDTSWSTYIICEGDSISVNGEVLYDEGETIQVLVSLQGCDSIHIPTVVYISVPGMPVMTMDCDMGLTLWALAGTEAWVTLWSSGDTTDTTTYASFGDQENVRLIHEDGCVVVYSFTIPLMDLPSSLDLPKDTTVISGSNLSYGLDLDSLWTINSVVGGIITDSLASIITISDIVEDHEVMIQLVNLEGCVSIHTFTITVLLKPDVVIPNIFSPNGDGVNDDWIIDFKQFPNNETLVFDRWGNQVAHMINENILIWDGRLNRQLLSTGVYVYLISYEDEEGVLRQIAGDITLVR